MLVLLIDLSKIVSDCRVVKFCNDTVWPPNKRPLSSKRLHWTSDAAHYGTSVNQQDTVNSGKTQRYGSRDAQTYSIVPFCSPTKSETIGVVQINILIGFAIRPSVFLAL